MSNPSKPGLLLIPHLQVQNANAISSPMTWGFPSMTAFMGLMHALQRKLGPDSGLQFSGVGVVCHSFQAQTHQGYLHSFCLSRNPVMKNGGTAAITEEGRIHLDISLVFKVNVSGSSLDADDTVLQHYADTVAHTLAGMRIAGGSVIAAHQPLSRRALQPHLQFLVQDDEDTAGQYQQFAQLSQRLLPGFALVSRDDVLQAHLAALRAGDSDPASVTALDAWLDLSRINYRAVQQTTEGTETTVWQRDERTGWLVPISVGYVALSALHPAGTVTQARDDHTPLRFVEAVYSMGQWISPRRLKNIHQIFWHPGHDPETGLYRCVNDYITPPDADQPSL